MPRRIAQVCVFYLLLLWLAVLLLLGNAVCLPLFLTSKRFREPIAQRHISRIFRLFLWTALRTRLLRLDLHALETLNGQDQVLLVANHPSMMDAFLVLSQVRQSICLMKASVTSNIFLGAGAYLAGYVSNRHPDFMLRRAIVAVRQGKLLLAFPEGTRTTRQPINAVKPGFALIAKRAAVPMQTILIVTNSAYAGKGWKLWHPPQFPLIYKVTLGEKLHASASCSETAQRLQDYFEQAVPRSIDPQLTLS